MENLILLLLTLTTPLFIAFLVVFILLGNGENLKSKSLSCFKLSHEHGLAKQGLLWIGILTPLLLGLSFGIWAWREHRIDLSASGFKEFIGISVLPLAAMSISLPLAGLISRFHSTHQAAKQISITMMKNNLDAFSAHRKGMLEYFSALDETKYFGEFSFKYKAHPVLHKRFFIGSPEEGWPSRDESSFDRVEILLRDAAKYLQKVLDGNSINSLNDYLQASTNIFLAAQAFHIKEITHDMAKRAAYIKHANDNDSSFIALGSKTTETLAALRFTREFYNNFCDFSGRPRMNVEKCIENVFEKTEHWLKKGDFIKNINMEEIPMLFKDGRADYGENRVESSMQ